MQEIVGVPVPEYAGAPVADHMIGAGKQRHLSDGRPGEQQDRERQQQSNEDSAPRRLPVFGIHQLTGPGKFGPQRRIEDAPIRTDIAFE
jgi:hypothetical protein